MTPTTTPARSGPDADPTTKCGYVTLLGAPNAGKSTLMNTMIGDDLSIVTPRAQTTWTRVTGIRTEGDSQMIFLDTPGILTPGSVIHHAFLAGAAEAADEADVLVLVADPTRSLDDEARRRIADMITSVRAPRVGVVNKVDVSSPERIGTERDWLESLGCDPIHEVSASEGSGIDDLLTDLKRLLPLGPFLYPEDEIASAPVRFFVAEMVRESIFELYREEIPYASICQVEEFRGDGDRTYIQVTIYVERSSQKGIVIGEKGRSIRELGMRARKRVEHFLRRPVYLDLWVKVLPNWRRKPHQLRRFGLPVPDQDRVRESP